MIQLPAGVTNSGQAHQGVVWNLLGQTYTLKQHSDDLMAWHAVFPPGTFVPPHVHQKQDEFLFVLSGRYDIWLDGKDLVARAGDHVRLPKGIPHAFFNKADEPATSMFCVAPTRDLKTLFDRINNMTNPEEMVRIASQTEVNFMPPPA